MKEAEFKVGEVVAIRSFHETKVGTILEIKECISMKTDNKFWGYKIDFKNEVSPFPHYKYIPEVYVAAHE